MFIKVGKLGEVRTYRAQILHACILGPQEAVNLDSRKAGIFVGEIRASDDFTPVIDTGSDVANRAS